MAKKGKTSFKKDKKEKKKKNPTTNTVEIALEATFAEQKNTTQQKQQNKQ
ncbi:hypothetical protein [Lysinibacillus sp. 54212]